MRLDELQDQQESQERRLNGFINHFSEFERIDRAWKEQWKKEWDEWRDKHENNHHGKMSNVKDKIPWVAIMMVLYGIMNYLVNGTTP